MAATPLPPSAIDDAHAHFTQHNPLPAHHASFTTCSYSLSHRTTRLTFILFTPSIHSPSTTYRLSNLTPYVSTRSITQSLHTTLRFPTRRRSRSCAHHGLVTTSAPGATVRAPRVGALQYREPRSAAAAARSHHTAAIRDHLEPARVVCRLPPRRRRTGHHSFFPLNAGLVHQHRRATSPSLMG